MIYSQNYKINLHILETCNYRCKHCFAHFNSCSVLSIDSWKCIVSNLKNVFPNAEFNIAGGEPLLYKKLPELIEYIHERKSNCSIITNGFLMDKEWIQKYAKSFQTIGFSIDTFHPDTQIKLGRCTKQKEYLSLERLQRKRLIIRRRFQI